MTGLRNTGTRPRTTLQGPSAKLTVAIDFAGIPGKPVLKDTLVFDGTPEGFDRALERLRVAFHVEARASSRPCGYAGPWAKEQVEATAVQSPVEDPVGL